MRLRARSCVQTRNQQSRAKCKSRLHDGVCGYQMVPRPGDYVKLCQLREGHSDRLSHETCWQYIWIVKSGTAHWSLVSGLYLGGVTGWKTDLQGKGVNDIIYVLQQNSNALPSYVDQLNQILNLLGTPTEDTLGRIGSPRVSITPFVLFHL